MKKILVLILTFYACFASALAAPSSQMLQAKTVFVIVMENHNWKDIKGNPNAPFINNLIKQGAIADNYFGPPDLHPSEPNYVWMISGSNHGIKDNAEPARNGLRGVESLGSQLNAKKIAWKTYQEDIDGASCPLKTKMPYAVKHNPFVFFADLTDDFSPTSSTCIAHNRPLSELKADLKARNTGQFVFITPNMCNDMHGNEYCDQTIPNYDAIKQGDVWLSAFVPMIQAESAYVDNGIIFITWDESEDHADLPIGLIALSPMAKIGYSNKSSRFTHSTLLRSIEDIFKLVPLGDAFNSGNLSDLFQ